MAHGYVNRVFNKEWENKRIDIPTKRCPVHSPDVQYSVSVQSKVNELFVKWLTLPQTQSFLQDALYRVKTGKTLPNSNSSSLLDNKPIVNATKQSTVKPVLTPLAALTPLRALPKSSLTKHVTKHNVTSYVHKKPLSFESPDPTFSFVVKNPTSSSHLETFSELKCSTVSGLVSKFSEQLKPNVPKVVSAEKQKNNKIPPVDQEAARALQNAQNSQETIPPFYFPLGRPTSPAECERYLKDVERLFLNFRNHEAFLSDFVQIAKAVRIPVYWKVLLYRACGGRKKEAVSFESFAEMWRNLTKTCHDMPSRFMHLMGATSQKPYLEVSDWELLVLDVVNSHPGLKFLKEAKEFISRYCKTVIARIYFCVNRSWSGRITLPELRRSNILTVISKLEEENDINKFVDYFSYEHFYVIYCKFWEIDTDHDLFISKEDLAQHNQSAISKRIIDRIFSGAVSNSKNMLEGLMSYYEFVWFLIAEEDKKHPTSIEYWFRCMDLDGDGILSMYELEYFYEEQIQRLEVYGFEFMQFEDVMCQMLDMIKPEEENKIKLKDLKQCKLINIFFDTFFNVEKFLEHEQKDPFTSFKDPETVEVSDWVRYASEEYENLVSEEQARNSGDEMEQKDYDENKKDANVDLSSSLLKDSIFNEESIDINKICEEHNIANNISGKSEPITYMKLSSF